MPRGSPDGELPHGHRAKRPAAQPWSLNAAVAMTVALLAKFMGIGKVVGANTVQALQQAQADHLALQCICRLPG